MLLYMCGSRCHTLSFFLSLSSSLFFFLLPPPSLHFSHFLPHYSHSFPLLPIPPPVGFGPSARCLERTACVCSPSIFYMEITKKQCAIFSLDAATVVEKHQAPCRQTGHRQQEIELVSCWVLGNHYRLSFIPFVGEKKKTISDFTACMVCIAV